jgi:hypothetical protein
MSPQLPPDARFDATLTMTLDGNRMELRIGCLKKVRADPRAGANARLPVC